jgi:hypothetical protein
MTAAHCLSMRRVSPLVRTTLIAKVEKHYMVSVLSEYTNLD